MVHRELLLPCSSATTTSSRLYASRNCRALCETQWGKNYTCNQTALVCVVVLWKTYGCVAIGAGEGAEILLREISELVLLGAHCEDGL